MDAVGYIVLFDVAAEPSDLPWSMISTGSLFTIGCGFFAFLARRAWSRVVAVALCVLGLVLTISIPVNWELKTSSLRAHLNEGRFEVVEGRVTEFVPDIPSGNRPQVIVVEGHRFEVSRLRHTPAFHQTVSAGGPNLRGRCVKVAYTPDNEILWLGLDVTGSCARHS